MQFWIYCVKLTQNFAPKREKRGKIMNCKFCNAELTEGEVVCLACGGNNAEPEKKKAVWKPILAVVCVVVLLAGIAAAVYFGMGGGESADQGVTAKSVYTGTDKQVLAAMDTVVAKAGDLELTNGELQVAYWSTVYDFIDYYGSYIYYIIDFSVPLSEQYYDSTNGITWEQYFLEIALETWYSNELLVQEAELAGVEMSEELVSYFDTLYQVVEADLAEYGYDSVADMIVHDFGAGGTYDNYVNFMRMYYYGSEYYYFLYDSVEVTEDELENIYSQNESYYESYGYSKEDGRMVTVRHILLQPNDDENATDYTDEEWANCLTAIEALQQQWLDAGGDEASFADLAVEYSACSSAANGGLIEDILEGEMVASFENWIMNPDNQYGDYGIVQSSYGYHLIFFVEGDELWRIVAESDLIYVKLEDHIAAAKAANPMTVEYNKICLGEVDLY